MSFKLLWADTGLDYVVCEVTEADMRAMKAKLRDQYFVARIPVYFAHIDGRLEYFPPIEGDPTPAHKSGNPSV